MDEKSIYDQFINSASGALLSYKGEIDAKLLESIYSSMDHHFTEDTSVQQRKRFYHVLVEALQNVFHHQSKVNISTLSNPEIGGFVINETNGNYQIITGNYIYNSAIDELKNNIDVVNAMPPGELRKYYQDSLASSELSEKGGAGLGIIEMVRKSGHALKYEFVKVNDAISFFCLSLILSKN